VGKKPDPQHHFVVRDASDETEIRETLYNFKERFENAEIATIKVMTVKDDFYTGLKFAVRCSPLAVSRLRRIEIVFGELR
jgi:hypothetical protein